MMNKEMLNPFMPSFGRFSKIVISQKEALTDYLTGSQTHDAKYQTSLVYGTRGAGKTVFLLNVQRSLEKLDNWCFIRLSNWSREPALSAVTRVTTRNWGIISGSFDKD